MTLIFVGLSALGLGADEYDDFMSGANKQMESFLDRARQDMDRFRLKMNEEYADFLSKPWEYKPICPPVIKPKEEPVPPVVIPEEDRTKPLIDNPIDITVVPPSPTPSPTPQPPTPIPVPEPAPQPRWIDVTLYGTTFKAPAADALKVNLKGAKPENVSDCWLDLLNSTEADRAILGLMKVRDESKLPDWVFFKLVRNFSQKVCGNRNTSRMLEGYILCQAGYDIRYARSGENLFMLVAFDEIIYDNPSYDVNSRHFYSFEDIPDRVYIMDFTFPKTSPMRLKIEQLPLLASNPGSTHTVIPVHYPAIKCSYTTDLNLMQFFEDYPVGTLSNNPVNPWSKFATTPFSPSIVKDLYPTLRQAIEGKSQRDAANIIIDFVESFPYEYDDKLWWHDRIFFPEETLHYHKSDCEDHAILFARLINDLMHLPTALIHYPGHLAAAVAFTEPVPGSYIMADNRRYTVCDPTIFYAGVGNTMSGMDNSTAQMLILPKF